GPLDQEDEEPWDFGPEVKEPERNPSAIRKNRAGLSVANTRRLSASNFERFSQKKPVLLERGVTPPTPPTRPNFLENRWIPYRFRCVGGVGGVISARVICKHLAGSSKTYSAGSLSVLGRTLCSGLASLRILRPQSPLIL